MNFRLEARSQELKSQKTSALSTLRCASDATVTIVTHAHIVPCWCLFCNFVRIVGIPSACC